jgi:hypothetical protein
MMEYFIDFFFFLFSFGEESSLAFCVFPIFQRMEQVKEEEEDESCMLLLELLIIRELDEFL